MRLLVVHQARTGTGSRSRGSVLVPVPARRRRLSRSLPHGRAGAVPQPQRHRTGSLRLPSSPAPPRTTRSSRRGSPASSSTRRSASPSGARREATRRTCWPTRRGRSSRPAGTRTPATGTATRRTCGSPRSCSWPSSSRRETSATASSTSPRASNGVPDILDEAAWLPRFCYRLRHELLRKGYGTGGIGLRIAGDAFGEDEKTLPDGKKVGQGSWEDVNRTWAASGEDPWSTYRYAGAAAQLARCLNLARVADPEGVDWAAEAREAYEWARKNTRPGDDSTAAFAEGPPRLRRRGALPAHRREGLRGTVSRGHRRHHADVGPLGREPVRPRALRPGRRQGQARAAGLQRIRAAVLFTADSIAVDAAGKRALRWGGNWYMPMLVGQQTTPLGASARRRSCADEAIRPRAGRTLPRRAGDHVRLLPRLQRAEHDLGHGPGAAPPRSRSSTWTPGTTARGSSIRASSPTAPGSRTRTRARGPGMPPGRTRPSIRPSMPGRATSAGLTTAARR